jgi:hypothetical protein
VLETRLDERDAAVLSIQDTHRLEIAALKKSLRTLRNIASDDIEEHNPLGINSTGGGKGKGTGMGVGRGAGQGILAGQRKTRGLLTFGDKLLSVSQKVNTLCVLAEGAVAKAATAEEEAMELKGASQDLSAEKDLLLQRCADLEAVNIGKSKQQAVASRLVALSEEVRTHKLAALQQRREIQVLRQEKKHLQNVLSTMEADVEDLEEGKVRAETKNLLMDISTSSSAEEGHGQEHGHAQGSRAGRGISLLGDTMDAYKKLRGGLMSLSGAEDDEGYEERKANSYFAPARFTSAVVAVTKMDNEPEQKEDVSALALSEIPPDLLIRKIQDMNDALSLSRREAGEARLRGDRLQSSLNECETALKEMERHVTHYEGVMVREGLPDIKGFEGPGTDITRHRGKQNLSAIDQEHLQEAATATMASMKQLLEEKNKVIEKYREKLEDAKTNKKPKTAADRKADALLERLTQESDTGGRSRMSAQGPGRGQMGDEEMMSAQNRLLGQIEEADHILMDKDRTISQLEQRLSSQENQRERAEIRCGTALKEMEAMKGDMILLAQQLLTSESKYTAHVQRQANDRLMNIAGVNLPSSQKDASEMQYGDDISSRPLAVGQDSKVSELQKIISAKNEKISGYRDIIVRLKEEFIKLEEEKAVAAVISKDKVAKYKSGGKESDGPESRGREEGTIGESAMRELRAQVVALRDGLRLAKEDLERARTTREKLTSARQAAQEEVNSLSKYDFASLS